MQRIQGILMNNISANPFTVCICLEAGVVERDQSNLCNHVGEENVIYYYLNLIAKSRLVCSGYLDHYEVVHVPSYL